MKLTPTEHVVRAVQANGGRATRADVLRLIAPRMSVRRAREAVHLAIAARYVDHDPATDTLTLRAVPS